MKRMSKLWSLMAILIALIGINVSTATAAGQWSWQESLDGGASGQIMVMPSSLYIDEEKGRYYVVDSGENRLLSFTRDGEFLHSFNAEGKLLMPFDMVWDDKGLLWVVEKGRNSLTSIDVKGKSVTPHILKDGDRVLYPDRLDYQGGMFFVLDKASGRIAILDSSLGVQRWINCDNCTGGIVDFKLVGKNIWALDQLDKRILKFTENGKLVNDFSVEGKASFPASLAIGPAGNVYVLDRHKGEIVVFDASGAFKYTFLSKGQSRGMLYYPLEILFDPWGRFCVVEEGNGRVELFGR